jgi:hypothetical protein
MSHTRILDKFRQHFVNLPSLQATGGMPASSEAVARSNANTPRSQQIFDLDTPLRFSPNSTSVDLMRAEELSPYGSSSLQTANQ